MVLVFGIGFGTLLLLVPLLRSPMAVPFINSSLLWVSPFLLPRPRCLSSSSCQTFLCFSLLSSVIPLHSQARNRKIELRLAASPLSYLPMLCSPRQAWPSAAGKNCYSSEERGVVGVLWPAGRGRGTGLCPQGGQRPMFDRAVVLGGGAIIGQYCLASGGRHRA